ncbi:MFS transporter [Quadrisphaera sp. DSM 44207]|uniref:MFS transporter n=1 Tax=Quadrisphaera sp. DSM 44207 TaxID=1881057 RepID=UPI000B25B1C4|nr:MFS transporter [Quadrisphaera sp. DSM 44207]
MLGSGVGWALDAMDVGLVSFVVAALVQQWSLAPTQASWIFSATFAGMAVGAGLGGLLADRIGRRQVFALTLLVYGLATGASALAWSLASLVVLRFVIGLGLGAELPVASTLVSEFAPARVRGRVVVVLEGFWAVGWLAAALIGFFVVAGSDSGWRWALAIGAVPALYAAVVRRTLPESVRFLERRGRAAEAEAVVRRFEASAGAPPPPGSATPQAAPAAAQAVDAQAVDAQAVVAQAVVAQAVPGPGALWSPRLRRRTAALWAVWFGLTFAYYGAFTWLPSLLLADGFTLVRSFEYTLVITLAQLPGYAVAAVLIETWGRRPTLAAFLAGAAGSAWAYGAADSVPEILLAGCALSFCALGAWGAVYAVTPEVYPTVLRATGAGSAAGFGRIASIVAPLAVPSLLDRGGTGLVFGVFAAAFALAAAAAWLLPEQRGASLEQAAPERAVLTA